MDEEPYCVPRRGAPRMEWQPVRGLERVQILSATNWKSSLKYYHDSLDFCLMDEVDGDRGPENHYRRWSQRAAPRDVLVFEPGEPHKASGGPNASFRVLLVPTALFDETWQGLASKQAEFHLSKFVAPELYDELDRLCRMLVHPDAPLLAIEDAFIRMVQDLVARSSESAAARDDRIDFRVIRRALEYMEDFLSCRPDRHVTLQDVMRSSGAENVSKLCRDFQRAKNIAVYEYWKLRKLSLVKRELIKSPRRRIEHIAWDYGYTISSLSRAFRAQFGVAPRAFRAAFVR